ncbi:hypothetical protein R1sor_017976 [Riccia sorocarpa]|uniref:Cysteine synthase n=1 Tax=Riccia sorocarpa TaxID=122646 RepID=A0ABD3IA64_9MARC
MFLDLQLTGFGSFAGGKPRPHVVQGTGPGMILETINVSVMDQLVIVTDEETLKMIRRLSFEEGLLVGISLGAAIAGALKVAKKLENTGKRIVLRYRSPERRRAIPQYNPFQRY